MSPGVGDWWNPATRVQSELPFLGTVQAAQRSVGGAPMPHQIVDTDGNPVVTDDQPVISETGGQAKVVLAFNSPPEVVRVVERLIDGVGDCSRVRVAVLVERLQVTHHPVPGLVAEPARDGDLPGRLLFAPLLD